MKRKPPLSLIFKRTTDDTPMTPYSPTEDNSPHNSTIKSHSPHAKRRSSFITEVLFEQEDLLPDEGHINDELRQWRDFKMAQEEATEPQQETSMPSPASLPSLSAVESPARSQTPIERIKRPNLSISTPKKRPHSKFTELHRKHRLKNAFPVQLTGGFYNLRYQSLIGNVEKVDDIFQYFTKEATPDGALVSNGLASLHSACLADQIKVVEYLLIEEANLELESHSGTPLQIAIVRRNVPIMKLLLEKGKADCNKRCTSQVDDWNAEQWYAQLDASCGVTLTPQISHDQRASRSLKNIRHSSPVRSSSSLLRSNPRCSPAPARSASRMVPLPSANVLAPMLDTSLSVKKRKSRNTSRSKKSHRPKKTIPKKRHQTQLYAQQYIQRELLVEEQYLHSLLGHREKVPLAICIDVNFLEGVQELLKQQSLLLENPPHIEALNRCVYLDRSDIASVLLKQYQKRYSREEFLNYHEEALRKALVLNKPKLVDVFLKHTNRLRASVFADILVELIKAQNLDVLEVLLKHGTHTKTHVRRLLHTAIPLNMSVCCDLLLKYGVPIEFKNTNGFTPLHIATEHNLLSIIPVLMAHHANTEALTPDTGYTPLHLAVSLQRHEVARILLKHDAFIDSQGALDHKTPLQLATALNDIKMVELLLQYSPNLEISCDTVAPVLHIACLKGFVELVNILLEAGANVESHYRAGTPLHNLIFAWKNVPNSAEIAKKLIAFRADIEAKSATNLTPLQLAVKMGCVEAIEILIRLKANVHVLYPNNDTLVHMAARLSSLETLQKLLVMGVWPARNNEGLQPQDLIPSGHKHAEDCHKLLRHYWKLYGFIYRNPQKQLEQHAKEQDEQFNATDWDHVMSKLKRRLNAALTLGRRSSIPWKLRGPPSTDTAE